MIALIFSLFLAAGYSPQNPVLEVSVHHAKSDEGKIRILVFSSEQGFPDHPDQAVRSFSLTPKEKSCIVRIEGLPPGIFAISVIHDQDESGGLTTNAVGYPLEKFGFSNNPKIYFGPPSFKNASFELQSGSKYLRINLR